MAVFRVERTGDYTVMSNFHLKDKRLSLKANMDVETIAVIKKNSKKYNTKGCVKVMGELS